MALIEDPDDLVDISELTNLTQEEVSNIAEYVIQVLEEDLADYVERTGTTFPETAAVEDEGEEEEEETKQQEQDQESAVVEEEPNAVEDVDDTCSLKSVFSELLPGDPSRVRLTYERGVSAYCDALLQPMPDTKVDKKIQVTLHRATCRHRLRKMHRYCQTLEMTFLTEEAALLVFKQMYPQSDDYKPGKPPSRKASEESAIKLGQQADQNADTKRKSSVISLSAEVNQLLQPLVPDYHKEEKFVTGCRFIGEYKSRQFFKGRYDHPTGVTMESEFVNGHFESKNHFGIVSYPRGDTFEGEWRKGRYQSGEITFSDGLKFVTKNWKYCEPPDRRFRIERYFGLKPAGGTLFSDQFPQPKMPPNTYDTGDGYYNPKTGVIRGYDGFLLRQVTPSEEPWIEKNCRKIHGSLEHCAPRFLTERIPGSYVETQRRVPLTKKIFH